MSKKKLGRKRGRRTKGYFFRTGRGWYSKDRGRFIPLCFEDGQPIKDKETDERFVQEAHARLLLSKQQKKEKQVEITVLEICHAYLAYAKDTGSDKTHADRADTLFDFCFGLPPEFRSKEATKIRKLSAELKKEMLRKRIHKGYGRLIVNNIRPLDIDQWLQAHQTWTSGGRRTRIQAVKRALNYGVESGLIKKNPIRGYRVPKVTSRVTYITANQEAAILESASHALSMAIRVCIRTGARPGKEFSKLTNKHITNLGERMEWKFTSDESKTKKLRIIRIADPEIIEITRVQMKEHKKGPIFRSSNGNPWTRSNLSQRFRFLKYKLQKAGHEFDDDCCIYSCRHTYAKRILEGYWTGKPTNIETLARLMGNSPQVCRDHYLQWSLVDNEFLWDVA